MDNEQQKMVNQIYEYAADLMVQKKKNSDQTKLALIKKGLDEESASVVVNNLGRNCK